MSTPVCDLAVAKRQRGQLAVAGSALAWLEFETRGQATAAATPGPTSEHFSFFFLHTTTRTTARIAVPRDHPQNELRHLNVTGWDTIPVKQ